MADNQNDDIQTSLVVMSIKKLLFIIAIGILAGAIIWGLAYLLDTYVYKAILCNGKDAVQCISSSRYATTTAVIIGAAVGLFGLVRLHVFRPLLIVISTLVSLWGLISLATSFDWYIQAIVVAAMYGFAFGVFGWLARIRRFYIALVAIVVVVVVTRLILNS
jgi:hypothetical protein